LVVRGNHDAYVVGHRQPDPNQASAYRTEWTRSQLSDSHRRWLAALPVELRFAWDGLSVIVRHASPWDEETYLYADSPALAQLDVQANELLVLGHTHRPMLVQAGDGRLLNPGSVGQPRDWNPKASYALVETGTKHVEVRRVSYDVAGFQARLEALGWNRELIDILGRQR
jgi:predicted phosphodiesterase